MLQLAPVLLRVPDGYWCKFVKDSPNHPVSQLQTVDALQPGVVEPTKFADPTRQKQLSSPSRDAFNDCVMSDLCMISPCYLIL